MNAEYEPIKFRYESFGGIIQLETPGALVFVDQDYMRNLGYPESPLWNEPTEILSAPTEVHLALTRHCAVGCRHCYMNSVPDDDEDLKELGREGVFQVLSMLAKMKVFHVALGGGESAELPWLFEVGHIARSLGLVPNLTTNGFFISAETAPQYAIFGQVNISIDGVGVHYGVNRGIDGYDAALRALVMLKEAGVRTGINCVVSRDNFDDLEEVFALSRRVGITQLELLRYKPAGRAATAREEFLKHDLTDEQAWRFYPVVYKLAKKYRAPLAIDCSFTPFLFAHNPDLKKVTLFGISGCHGGNLLMGVDSYGVCSACSFTPGEKRLFKDIDEWWGREETFFSFRHWSETAPEPCKSCRYLSLCQGGCHVVSRFITGDVFAPDPRCPIVRRHRDAV